MIRNRGTAFTKFDVPPAPFEIDVLLPVQLFSHPSNRSTPEKRLMMAILDDAIDCMRKYHMCRRAPGRRLFHDAHEWMLDPVTDWPFSFENICDMLGIPSTEARRRILKSLADDNR